MQAAAGNEHTSVLSSDGSVYCCGYNDSGQCGQGHTGRVPTLRRIEAFDGKQVVMIQSANGCEHLAAVTEDGELYTCGTKKLVTLIPVEDSKNLEPYYLQENTIIS